MIATSEPLFVSLPTIHTNSTSNDQVQVRVLLVKHQDKTCHEMILKCLEGIQNPQDYKLVVESDPSLYATASIETVCWEKKDLLPEIYKTYDKFCTLREIIHQFTSSGYPVENKIQAVQCITNNYKRIYPHHQPIDFRELRAELIATQDQNLLQNKQQFFLVQLNELFAVFINQTVRKTFVPRQTNLMDHIAANLQDRRLIVICGKWHGDTVSSPFPEEVKRLLNFLRENTIFEIIDTTAQNNCNPTTSQ